MKEPTAAFPRDDYTFTRPEGLLAHYTDASAAFEHILPGKLRLSPYRFMSDPAENKDIKPNICSLRPSPDDARAIEDVYALIKTERDRMRVLSLALDAEDRGDYTGYDCCWARPRMWEQYADKHRGVCLLFDRPRLERAIVRQWPDKRKCEMRIVEYWRDASERVYKRGVNADRILDHEQPARAVADHIRANRDAFFFLKSDDFATEHEYRVVLSTGDDGRDDYAYVDYGDSLQGVVLGERFPEWQDSGAIEQCARANVKLGALEQCPRANVKLGALEQCPRANVKLGWMNWVNGRPRVLRSRLRCHAS